MLSSAPDQFDLHTMTMDVYRARITSAFRVAGHPVDPDLIEELARLMDVSASERVLDEAEVRELPNSEHPAVRDLRDRLRHSEALINTIALMPARRFAAVQHTLDEATRTELAKFVLAVREANTLPSRGACSEVATKSAAQAYDAVLDLLDDEVFLSLHEPDHPWSAHMIATFQRLFAEVATLRASLFRDAASLATIAGPEIVAFAGRAMPRFPVHTLESILTQGLAESWSEASGASDALR